MNNSRLLFQGFLFSLGVIVYIVPVSVVMRHGEAIFGKMQHFWGPVGFLMLFTLSAAVVGLLVFGRPVYLFLNGFKREGVKQVLYTVSWLFVETVIVLIGLAAKGD
jgi:hypothetical protein